jgi:hypothetical protein
MIETRLEVTLKMLQWNPNVADLSRVAKELDLSAYEFNTMSDEDFFHKLFEYYHNRDTLIIT